MKEKKSFKIKKWVVWALLIVVTLWGLNWLAFMMDYDQRGTMGDMFGTVNALFSGLAFAGIIITIYMQKHELELQRNELKSTRKVFKKQSKKMTAQQNDNTFFNLLENHRQLVESFRTGHFKSFRTNNYLPEGVTEAVSGYEVLARIVQSWQDQFKEFSTSFDSSLIVMPKGNFINDRKLFPIRKPVEIINDSPSVQNLFNDILVMFQFIEKQFSIENQAFYKSILWNNISENEKFIFECFYVNRPELRDSLVHEVRVYSKFDYPDFLKTNVPDLEFRSLVYAESYAVSVHKTENMISARLLCYEENGWEIKLWSVQSLSTPKLHVYLPDDLSVGGMSYHELSLQAMNSYKNRKYALEVVVEHQSQQFTYVIGIDSSIVSSSIFDGKYKLTQDGIRILSRETAETLVALANESEEK